MLPDEQFFREYARSRRIPWRKKNILIEYLQTRMLKALSLSAFNDGLSFLGGTCLRFAHNLERFSEDLDFDDMRGGISPERVSNDLVRALSLDGFDVESRVKTTENIHIILFKFRCVFREFGLSALEDEKALVKFEIDFAPLRSVRSETRFADSFNERFPLLVNTKETLFAQKILAILFRPYQKGRDFYDLVWFLSQKNLEPNYDLFAEKNIPVRNRQELAAFLLSKLAQINLAQAARDVEPFLFYPEQSKWILKLPEQVKGLEE